MHTLGTLKKKSQCSLPLSHHKKGSSTRVYILIIIISLQKETKINRHKIYLKKKKTNCERETVPEEDS